jgi:competence protein ComEC
LVRSSALLDWAPWLAWRVAPPSLWVVASYYAAIVAAWALWRRGPVQAGHPVRFKIRDGRFTGTAAIACAAAAWIVIEPWQWAATAGDGRLHVTFIDVGQGDATSIRFPDGQTLLVDAGGLSGSASFDIGERVVAPVLRRHGVARLDRLALTHGDADHIGGAASILEEFRPREVWEGIPVPRLAALQALRSAAGRGLASWRNVQAGDRVLVGGVEVAVRHPAPPDWERQDVRNEDSVVIELVWRDVSIWLAGDIGAETEPGLAAGAGPSRLRIVKVPHHGSLTSSSPAFVRGLSPRAVIASAGRHNTFGHPAPAVLARYRQIGASVFRTDQDGAVTVVTDGRVVDVETVSGRRGRYK